MLKHIVEEADTRCVFKVAKAESIWNPLRLVNIQKHEVVQECLVEWHEDHLVSGLDHSLDHLDTAHVDVKSLDGPAHVLVEEVHQHPHAT